GDRAGDLQGRPDPDPGRSHVGARLRIRAARAGCADDADAWAHQHRDRAPPVDDRARRSHRLAAGRARCRTGHARRAAGARRVVRSAPRAATQELNMTDAISRYPVPELADLPEDVRRTILEVQQKAGFVPNVFLVLARRPDEFRAFFAYHDALMLRESGL